MSWVKQFMLSKCKVEKGGEMLMERFMIVVRKGIKFEGRWKIETKELLAVL